MAAQDSLAWKERINMEDKAMLSFIKDYRRLHKGESGNVPSGFNQTHILPHILSEGEHSIRQPAFLSSSSLGRPSSSGVDHDRPMSSGSERPMTSQSMRSASSRPSTGRSIASITPSEAADRIDRLERTLNQERESRLAVQKELEHLKTLMMEVTQKK